MGWSDADARGPGVDGEARIAVGILREGLPEAIEKGVVRILDGPEYNIPLSPSDNPNIGPSPTTSIMWHAMSATSSLKVYDTETKFWRVRSPLNSHFAPAISTRLILHVKHLSAPWYAFLCRTLVSVMRVTHINHETIMFPMG